MTVTIDEIFSRFAREMRERQKHGSWDAFNAATDIAPATTNRILANGITNEMNSRLESRTEFARGLGFKDWFDLRSAFNQFAVTNYPDSIWGDLLRSVDNQTLAKMFGDINRAAKERGLPWPPPIAQQAAVPLADRLHAANESLKSARKPKPPNNPRKNRHGSA